ncbi:MAG: class I SAM-dependent methyltransferase [Acidimicrobiia bacterium]|nr:class I SAM-dependent methyltransferase [Acidimicrobiia bacterium]
MPGGRVAHRALNPFVVRHADELRRQMGEYATTVTRALDEIREFEYHVDATFRRLLELVAQNEHHVSTVHFTELEVERRVAELAAHRDPTWFRPWFTNDAFEAAFRGGREEILDRYRDLIERLDGCAPVLDIGCGRGEILDLLAERGVEARGVELDPELARDASRRGLDVSEADGLTTLAGLPDADLGGIVLIQVIEHLSPQQIADLVPLAASKLRDGGRLIVETVNPLSLYVFGHAFYLDPTHLRLVHPFYLEFLAREAGFADVRTEWRSLPRDEDRLSEIPVDDPSAEVMNPVVRRLNEVLFGPQDYALIATR